MRALFVAAAFGIQGVGGIGMRAGRWRVVSRQALVSSSSISSISSSSSNSSSSSSNSSSSSFGPGKLVWASSLQTPAGLDSPSQEQRDVIDAVVGGQCNVAVNAVAGSGKTTTILHVASCLLPKEEKVLALLYSARLKDETREKARTFSLSNLDVHSFHAFAVRHYDKSATKDDGLARIVESLDGKPTYTFSYDLVVIDEIQDMTPLLAKFVFKILRDNRSSRGVRLLVLGDDRQNIFGFKSADARFLTLSDSVFRQVNDLPWVKLPLRTTFRLTRNMATFLNQNVLHYPLFSATKGPGPSVQYNRGNNFEVAKFLADELGDLLRNKAIKPDDIFIIGPSIKQGTASQQTPINTLANLLLAQGFPYYAPVSEEQKLSDESARNKIVVSTFHQTKGLERKVVVVFGFSNKYFQLFGKTEEPNLCPNILYVACTRASDRLILVAEDMIGHHLPFLTNVDSNNTSPHLEVRDVGRLRTGEELKMKPSSVSVTRLCKYLPEHVSAQAINFLKTRQLVAPFQSPNLESHVETSPGMVEEVYELNGLAIPALFERRMTKSESTIQSEAYNELSNSTSDNVTLSLLAELSSTYSDSDISAHLRLATIYSYATSGFLNKPQLIKDYDWISLVQAEDCINVLKEHLKGKVTYEYDFGGEFPTRFPFPPLADVEIKDVNHSAGGLISVKGRIDAITPDGLVWELKCVNNLLPEHLLQLAVYAWMVHRQGGIKTDQKARGKAKAKAKVKLMPMKAFPRLLNMRTGELVELVSSIEELDAAVGLLVENHLKGAPVRTDAEFMSAIAAQKGPNAVAREPGSLRAAKGVKGKQIGL